MFTRTSEYALRALIYLARQGDSVPMPGWRIAREAGIPPKYLSKILHDLVRQRILVSSPGKTGGFRFRRPPHAISLFEVLAPFEMFEHRRCPFGNRECSDKDPCLAHDNWKKVVEAQRSFLQQTSIEQIAIKRERARSRRRAGAPVRRAGG